MTAPPLDPPGPPVLPPDPDLVAPRGADPESAINGPVAGRYDLGDRIARGGMGIVYRAHDRLLNRTVAVKVMRGKYMDRPDLLRRFLAEARINGRLQHPGIVPVYEVGTLPDARPFIAMKLIEGQTLARLLRERTGPADNLAHYLKVFEALCQTMAYAHRQGVIHRDLKPDNIMVGPFGEVQVMDWGLAKFLDPAQAVAPTPDGFFEVERSAYLSDAASLPGLDAPTQATAVVAVGPEDPVHSYTTAGEVFGTPAYMPPEQARGEVVDRRGDVFSLGAILCEILTGQPPYFGPPDQLREMARDGKLFGASVLLDRCGADLALVLLAKNCLAPEPLARPEDAGELARLVTECLEGLQDRTREMEVRQLKAEARATELEAREKLAKQARRLARMLAVAGVVVAALLAAGLGWYARDRANRTAAEDQRRTEAAVQINNALADADRMEAAARTAAGGPQARDAAAREARAACQRAEALFATAPPLPEEFRDRFDEVNARVTRTADQARLTADLDRWRAELFDPKGGFDPAPAARRCRETLAGLGLDVLALDPADAANRLNAHPAAPALRDVLTNWLAVTPDAEERKRLVTVLRATGDGSAEPWLAALTGGNLDELARSANKDLPAAGVAVVARRLAEAGRTPEAEQVLRQGVERFPADYTLNAQLGALLRKSPETKPEALKYLSAARAARPTDAGANLELGSALVEAGRADEALEVFKAAAKADPKAVGTHLRVGDLLLARGQADEAWKSYAEAARLDGKSVPAQVGLGTAELARGDVDAADRAFKAAEKLDRKDPAAQAGLGRVHLKRWEAHKAIARFRTATAGEPGNVDYRLGLSEALRVSNDLPGALKEARSATQWAPGSAPAHRALGDLLRLTGDKVGAVVAYQAAAKLEPADADTHQALGALFEALNDHGSAAKAYQAAAALRPKDPKLAAAVARTVAKAGDKTSAADGLRQLLAADPGNASVRHQLGRLLVEAGDEAGIAELETASKAAPDSGEVLADYGEALLRFGKFRPAASALRAAADKLPADSPRKEACRSTARTATRWAGLEVRLPEVLSGAAAPTTPAAWADFGEMCRRTKRYAAAAKFFAAAAEGDAKYAPAAATCAALAGFGRGTDASDLSDEAKAELRQTALAAFKRTKEWASDPALAGLRDSMATLPADERDAWQAVWSGQ